MGQAAGGKEGAKMGIKRVGGRETDWEERAADRSLAENLLQRGYVD